MPNSESLSAKNIRAARAYLNLSQQELADGLGVDRSTVGRWERGEIFAPCAPADLAIVGFGFSKGGQGLAQALANILLGQTLLTEVD